MARVLLLILAAVMLTSCDRAIVGGGEGMYASRCAYCHGKAGRGDGPAALTMRPAPPDFTRADYWADKTRASIAAGILAGRPGTAMPGYKGILSEEELGMLVDHIESFRPQGGSEE
jgi:cytochrome c oxidase cbb3-type subunit 3